jgi:hypothetical protein
MNSSKNVISLLHLTRLSGSVSLNLSSSSTLGGRQNPCSLCNNNNVKGLNSASASSYRFLSTYRSPPYIDPLTPELNTVDKILPWKDASSVILAAPSPVDPKGLPHYLIMKRSKGICL